MGPVYKNFIYFFFRLLLSSNCMWGQATHTHKHTHTSECECKCVPCAHTAPYLPCTTYILLRVSCVRHARYVFPALHWQRQRQSIRFRQFRWYFSVVVVVFFLSRFSVLHSIRFQLLSAVVFFVHALARFSVDATKSIFENVVVVVAVVVVIIVTYVTVCVCVCCCVSVY